MRRYGGRYGYAVGKSVPPPPPSLPPQINTHPIIGPLVALMKRDVQEFISEVRQMCNIRFASCLSDVAVNPNALGFGQFVYIHLAVS